MRYLNEYVYKYYNKNARQCIIGEEIMPARPWGVPRPQAKGLPGSGGHYFFSKNALEGILYFISPHLGSKRVYFDNKQWIMV